MKRMICVTAMLLLSAPLGWAQTQAHRSTVPAGRAEEQAMLDAIQRLNEQNPIMVGSAEAWKGEHSSGSVRLDRIFHAGARDCHAMTYHVTSHPPGTAKSRHSTRHATWCRTGEGPWRES